MPNIKSFNALCPPHVPQEYSGTRYPELDTYLQDETNCFYIYRMIRGVHTQTGLVSCVDIKDFNEGRIKCHEHVRPEKIHIQLDQMKTSNCNIEPILLAYDSNNKSIPLIEEYADSNNPDFDFFDTDEPAVKHQVWRITDENIIHALTEFFKDVDAFYVCDGHHRIAASAAYYDKYKSKEDPEGCESRYLMASIFPSHQMLILDYNRTVEDLNGLSKDEFISQLHDAGFIITETSSEPFYPNHGEYTMILDNIWYRLSYEGERDKNNPVASLDVSILQDLVLDGILGIHDPRNDERLGFIRGTRGLHALQEATQDDMGVAFAIPPVSMEEILTVAKMGLTMPPKSTCFEPKPISGLIIHEL